MAVRTAALLHLMPLASTSCRTPLLSTTDSGRVKLIVCACPERELGLRVLREPSGLTPSTRVHRHGDGVSTSTLDEDSRTTRRRAHMSRGCVMYSTDAGATCARRVDQTAQYPGCKVLVLLCFLRSILTMSHNVSHNVSQCLTMSQSSIACAVIHDPILK